jgi:hypothetical protein
MNYNVQLYDTANVCILEYHAGGNRSMAENYRDEVIANYMLCSPPTIEKPITAIKFDSETSLTYKITLTRRADNKKKGKTK